MQTPLPIDEQIYVLRRYLITLQADHDHVDVVPEFRGSLELE